MSTNMKANRRKTLLLVETAMLTAVILVMSFTRLGYLTVGPLELTLIMVPVIIGAVTEGPAVSAFWARYSASPASFSASREVRSAPFWSRSAFSAR